MQILSTSLGILATDCDEQRIGDYVLKSIRYLTSREKGENEILVRRAEEECKKLKKNSKKRRCTYVA